MDGPQKNEARAVQRSGLSGQTTSGHGNSAPALTSRATPSPWTDVEIVRFKKRVGLFERRGLPVDDAEALADRLVHRDRDRDDRRCCLECDSLQQTNTCFRNLPISRIQLVRCVGFKWQKP